jgi:hypothetical protein
LASPGLNADGLKFVNIKGIAAGGQLGADVEFCREYRLLTKTVLLTSRVAAALETVT